MKKRASGFIRLILVIAAIAAAAFLPAPLLDRLFLPWAFARADRPALTGSWVGSLTTATGRPRGVVFELRLPEPEGEGGLVRDSRRDPGARGADLQLDQGRLEPRPQARSQRAVLLGERRRRHLRPGLSRYPD